ncbi:MAG: diacylglycerol kinase family lipid kinase [Opitutaceae bacterium]|nr:diacylglycerol kinase family lipid kinase [Opitutaceae bacterium]
MKIRLIVNLRSGRAARVLPAVRAFAERHGATVVLTERPGHASALAAAAIADGCGVIAAVGGDGTMNEVASALVGTPATLGLVPCGSGDGLGRHLRIHGPVARALDILVTGRPRLIDTGLADGRPFFTAAGLGFEAEIARRFNALARRGFARYLTTAFATWREWQPEQFSISTPTERLRVRTFTLAVANANQYGNNAFIAAGAALDDGQLDLCAIPPVTLWNGVPLAARLFRGTIASARGVVAHRAARFTVERAAPGLLHTDGELHHVGARVDFTVRPASLRVMAPA